jgi:hypothetical protein
MRSSSTSGGTSSCSRRGSRTPRRCGETYESAAEIILCVDGLQPEKGHETLYVVRELTRKRVWFAEPLLSATEDEVRRLIAKAKGWAESLGVPVGLWMSDKQEAFVTGIAAEFPDVPHRYCDNHFLRDLAKPVLEADSHAKVRMRKKVRGLRAIEQAVLRRQKAEPEDDLTSGAPGATGAAPAAATRLPPWSSPPAAWCSTIARRCAGSSTTIKGGRCIPPGCGWPRRSTRCRSRSDGTWGEKGGFAEEQLGRLSGCIRAGLDEVKEQQEVIRGYVGVIAEVAATLEPGGEDITERQEEFEALIDRFEATEDPIRHGMAAVMLSFLDGLFVGEPEYEAIRDNLELERWFRLPKSHERRIHGHRHAGIRLVLDGATLVPALDAHASHPGPFTADDLLPYRAAREPSCQTEARSRRTIMRRARSPKQRPLLLAELERRYRETPEF